MFSGDEEMTQYNVGMRHEGTSCPPNFRIHLSMFKKTLLAVSLISELTPFFRK